MPAPKPKSQRAKARVMYCRPEAVQAGNSEAIYVRKTNGRLIQPLIVIPCATLRQAKPKVRIENMTPQQLADKVADIVSIQLATAFVRGQFNAQVVTEKREDYQCAREILTALGFGPSSP